MDHPGGGHDREDGRRVRDRTVVPAQQGAKYVVYGFFAAFFVLTALLLLTIVTFRVLYLRCRSGPRG